MRARGKRPRSNSTVVIPPPAPSLRRNLSERSMTSSLGSPRENLVEGSGSSSWPDHRSQIDNNDWYGKLSRDDFRDSDHVVSHIRDFQGHLRCPFGSTPQLLATLYAESEFTWKDTIAKGCPTWTETQEHENLAKELWENQKYQDGWESPSHPNGGQYSRTD
eukprot:2643996-Rhodomonas_salina.1